MAVKNTKAKGTRNEHRSIRLLETAGYICIRSSASLGAFDVVGIRGSDFVLVQVKSNRWPSPAEIEAMREFRAPPNCIKLIHKWVDHERFPVIKEVP